MMRLFADLLPYSMFNNMVVQSSHRMIYHKYQEDSANARRYHSLIPTSYFSSMQSMAN